MGLGGTIGFGGRTGFGGVNVRLPLPILLVSSFRTGLPLPARASWGNRVAATAINPAPTPAIIVLLCIVRSVLVLLCSCSTLGLAFILRVSRGRPRGSSSTDILFTGEALGRFELPLPPISELKRILIALEAVSGNITRLEAIQERKAIALGNLRKSTLHRAFSGEL